MIHKILIAVLTIDIARGDDKCGPSCSCTSMEFPPMTGWVCQPYDGGNPCCSDAEALCADNGTQWPLCSSKEGNKICPHNSGGCHNTSATAVEPVAFDSHYSQPLTLLSDPKAKCMDGTQSGYYYRPSPQSTQTKWVLTLQGGGECVSSKCNAKAPTLTVTITSNDCMNHARLLE